MNRISSVQMDRFTAAPLMFVSTPPLTLWKCPRLRNQNSLLRRENHVWIPRSPVPRRSRWQASAKPQTVWNPAFDAAILNRSLHDEAPKTYSQPEQAPLVARGFTAERIRYLLFTTWRLAAPFWKLDRTAVWHGLACLMLHVADSAFGAVFTALSGSLITALSERNVQFFTRTCLKAFALCSIAVPISALTVFIRSTLVLRWKQFLTKRGLGLYFEGGNYYKLSHLTSDRKAESNGNDEEEPDNPDEVLQHQFASFAENMVDLAMQYTQTIVEIGLYSVMLLRIFPPLYLFILLIVGIGMLLINKIGKRLVDLQALRLRRAAVRTCIIPSLFTSRADSLMKDFRFALARIRIHAESIAFYNGADHEKAGAEGKLDTFAGTVLDLIKARVPVDMFINSFYYLPSVIPLLVLGPLFFAKRIQLGQLTSSISAFNVLFDNLSTFVGQYDRFSSLGASVERLSRFVSSLEGNKESDRREFNLTITSANGVDLTPSGEPDQDSSLSSIETSGSGLQLKAVSVDTPDGQRRILNNVSLSLEEGEKLLIVGASGFGKTSLLRAVAGLWTRGSGTIVRPTRSDMFFMPQRPYCTQGTLREQLLYPKQNSIQDEELESVLRIVGLPGLSLRAGGLDSVQDWTEYLSVGETQRLAFARLLISKPRLALIDEGSSALDLVTEDMLMRMLGDLNCTVVSVGHRPSLVKYHDRVLHLNGSGNGCDYSVVDAKDFVYPGAG